MKIEWLNDEITEARLTRGFWWWKRAAIVRRVVIPPTSFTCKHTERLAAGAPSAARGGEAVTSSEIQARWDAAVRAGDDVALAMMVVGDVFDFPRECMDVQLTPFATIRELMGGMPPRWFGRRRWYQRLLERVAIEVAQQRAFVERLVCARKRDAEEQVPP